jgi:hypothetical protein
VRISLMRAAVVVLACVASLTPALAGTAAAKCQPGRVNNGSAYFAGWSRNSSTVGGVYSLILNYSPWVQPNSQVTAWTMLTLSNNNTKWAQVGWWEEAGGVRHTFTQYTDNSTWHTLFLSPKAVGTSTYYTTLYDAGTHKFTFQVAGSTVQTVTAVFAPNGEPDHG